MGLLFMSFLKGLLLRGLVAKSFWSLKNCGKFDLLKNTTQGHRTCVRNHQFSNWNKKFHVCAETLVDFFYAKGKIKDEKMFQTCTMDIREFFFFSQKSHLYSSDKHEILPYTGKTFGKTFHGVFVLLYEQKDYFIGKFFRKMVNVFLLRFWCILFLTFIFSQVR